MAVRGVYTELEQKMLNDTNEKFNSMVGWVKFPEPLIATKESMKNYAYAVDPKNPLWRDENYARNTRWGGLIAVPGFTEKLGVDPYLMLAPRELGFQKMHLIGEDDEIRRPIRENDSFRVWRRRPQLQDVTDLDGKGPRKFTLMVEDFDLINQNDELVNTFKHYIQVTFIPKAPEPLDIPEYGYTREELEYTDRIEAEEEIRGREIRYWEDVCIGDDGFIRKYHYRLVNPSNLLGEILMGHGRVVGKRSENKNHLVDLQVWVENMRGGITEAALTTVSLLSKAATFQMPRF